MTRLEKRAQACVDEGLVIVDNCSVFQLAEYLHSISCWGVDIYDLKTELSKYIRVMEVVLDTWEYEKSDFDNMVWLLCRMALKEGREALASLTTNDSNK